MGRAQLRYNVHDAAGNVITNARVLIYEPGTNTLADDLYEAETGGAPVASLVTDAQGDAVGWLSGPRDVEAVATDNANAAYLPGDPTSLLSFPDGDRELVQGMATVAYVDDMKRAHSSWYDGSGTRPLIAAGPDLTFGDVTDALNAMVADRMGEDMIVDAGVYDLYGPLRLYQRGSDAVGPVLRGAGEGRTVFRCMTADAGVWLAEPRRPGVLVAGCTPTTLKIDGLAPDEFGEPIVFLPEHVGRRLAVNNPNNNQDVRATVLAYVSPTEVTLAAPLGGLNPFSPAAGALVNIPGYNAGRSPYMGHFTVNANDIAKCPVNWGGGASARGDWVRAINATSGPAMTMPGFTTTGGDTAVTIAVPPGGHGAHVVYHDGATVQNNPNVPAGTTVTWADATHGTLSAAATGVGVQTVDATTLMPVIDPATAAFAGGYSGATGHRFEAIQNGVFTGVEANTCYIGKAFWNGCGNLAFVGDPDSTCTYAVHCYDLNRPTPQSSGNDKVSHLSELSEQVDPDSEADDESSTYAGTLVIRDGVQIDYHRYAFNGPGVFDPGQDYSSSTCLRFARLGAAVAGVRGGMSIQAQFHSCQVDAKNGYAVHTSGGTPTAPVELGFDGHTLHKGHDHQPKWLFDSDGLQCRIDGPVAGLDAFGQRTVTTLGITDGSAAVTLSGADAFDARLDPVPSDNSLSPGATVHASGVPQGAQILSVTDATHATLTHPAVVGGGGSTTVAALICRPLWRMAAGATRRYGDRVSVHGRHYLAAENATARTATTLLIDPWLAFYARKVGWWEYDAHCYFDGDRDILVDLAVPVRNFAKMGLHVAVPHLELGGGESFDRVNDVGKLIIPNVPPDSGWSKLPQPALITSVTSASIANSSTVPTAENGNNLHGSIPGSYEGTWSVRAGALASSQAVGSGPVTIPAPGIGTLVDVEIHVRVRPWSSPGPFGVMWAPATAGGTVTRYADSSAVAAIA